ncbi:MAG: hypothetical protein ACFB6R_16300 [Alphaproteobacteria bacterium]
MAKRTSPGTADGVLDAQDLEDLVQDKREGWRASSAKARRRQRRYKTQTCFWSPFNEFRGIERPCLIPFKPDHP